MEETFHDYVVAAIAGVDSDRRGVVAVGAGVATGSGEGVA